MDPQQQQHLAGVIASMGFAFMFFGLVIAAFVIFLFWRVLARAGMAGPLALLVLIPAVGWVIVLCILAFGEWRVAPLPPGYAPGSPVYPPQPYPPAQASAYPPPAPTNYPPTGPPPQL